MRLPLDEMTVGRLLRVLFVGVKGWKMKLSPGMKVPGYAEQLPAPRRVAVVGRAEMTVGREMRTRVSNCVAIFVLLKIKRSMEVGLSKWKEGNWWDCICGTFLSKCGAGKGLGTESRSR